MKETRFSLALVSSFILAMAAFMGSPWIFWKLTKNQRLADGIVFCNILMGPILDTCHAGVLHGPWLSLNFKLAATRSSGQVFMVYGFSLSYNF